MNNTLDILKNEEGNLMVVVVLILALLSFLGVSASTTSTREVRIAANDQFHQMAFYAAEGGVVTGIQLLEENLESRGNMETEINNILLNSDNINFYLNEESTEENDRPTTENWDAEISNINGNAVYLKIYGTNMLNDGSALQTAAGYEGKGKSMAGGGLALLYDIRSLSSGLRNTRSRVRIKYIHL